MSGLVVPAHGPNDFDSWLLMDLFLQLAPQMSLAPLRAANLPERPAGQTRQAAVELRHARRFPLGAFCASGPIG